MTYTLKLLFFPGGAILGGILAIALKQWGILPADFDGRWIAVVFALGGLALGHWIDNKRECARIARELDEDRLRASVSALRNNAVEQSLAADGAIACFSSNLLPSA